MRPDFTNDEALAREGLERRVKALERALGTLIAWLPQSANSPTRKDEAETLLQMLVPLQKDT